ncbi:unnamed protein product [Symbiodinium sp. KB8]|nr:unnamed protein product [Symbiodinium sp. KB8]
MVGDGSETVKRSVVLGAVQSEIDASGLDEAATLSVLWGANEVELAPALVTAHLLHLSAPRSRLFRAVLCAASGKPMAKEIAASHADELTKLSADMPAEADLSLANAEVGDEVVGSVDAAAALEAAKHARTVRRADATCGKYLPPDQPWVLHSGDSVFISSEGFVSSDPAADNGDSKQAHVAQPATAVVGHSPLYSGAHYYECVLSQNGHEVLHTLREVHLEVTRARRLALQDAKSKKEAQEGAPSGTPIGGDAKQADGDSAAGVEDGRIFTGRQQRAGGWKDAPTKPEPSSTGVGWLANEDQLLVLRGDGKVACGDEILADAGRALKLGDVVGVTADLGKGQVVFYLNHKSVACVALADIEGLAGSADAPLGLRPAVRVNAHTAWHVFLGSKGWSEATTALLMAESGYLSAAPAFKASLFSVFMSAQQTIPDFANVLESKAGEEEEAGSSVLPTNHAPVSATLQWREEMQELLRSGARAGKLVELRDRSVIKEYTAETSSTDYSYYCTLAGLTFSSGKYLFEFSFDKGAQGALGFRTAPFRFSANQQKGLHDNAAFGIDGMTPSCSNHWMGELFVKRGMAHQGERWKTDVTYSIAVDMDVGTVWYGVDGKWTLPNGPAYRHIREVAASGLNMAVHLYASSRCKINVGQSPFKCDAPQPGFQPLLAWFSERLELLNKVKESAASTEGAAAAAEAAQ